MTATTDVTHSLAVGGMTCGACAARVERKLNGLDGVEAIVNYASERARIRSRSDIPVEDLVEAVRASGYSAVPVDDDASGLTQAGEIDDADARVRSLRRRLIVSFLLFLPLGELTIALSLFPEYRFPFWQAVLVLLAAPIVTWCAWPFYVAAVRALRHGTTTMDTLVSLGILAATSWSLYAMFRLTPDPTSASLWDRLSNQAGGLYFEVAAGVTTFLLAGRYVEASWRRRTGNVLRSLASMAATDAAVLDAKGIERRLPVRLLAVDDVFVVRPGDVIATDGIVQSGESAIDASTMTGESLPVDVGVGDAVVGGTICVGGRLLVRATSVGEDTQLAHLLRLVEDAQNQKASAQRLADRIAAIFVPVVLGIAVATMLAWLVSGSSAEQAVSASISVLIIACPCSLGLATPAALLVATGRGADLGVFFTGHDGLESSRRVDTVVFDKTGTITDGHMVVDDLVVAHGLTPSELLSWAGGVEAASEHPLGRAIVRAAVAEVGTLADIACFEALPGLGAQGLVDGRWVQIGKRDLVCSDGRRVPLGVDARCRAWEDAGATAVLVACDGVVVGAISVTSSLRPSARPAVTQLHELGLRVLLLTGDNARTAAMVAESVGITEVVSEARPDDKSRLVRELQARGRVVAMIGDGVNDAAALTAADLGIAVGSGTDVARTAADLIVMNSDLRTVATSILLARATMRTIRGNLAWAFGYNAAAIPLAALGLLNPLVAGAAMACSSAFVVWNSSRLNGFTPPPAAPLAARMPSDAPATAGASS